MRYSKKNITQINTVGIDLAKIVIQVFAADREGQQLMGGIHFNNSSEHSFSSFSSLQAALAHSIATLSRSSHSVAN